MWLFVAFLLIPIIEIALFIQVGGAIGLVPTLGLVVLTAIAGTFLMRRQGFATLRDLQSRLDEGRNPVSPIAHGAMILFAGAMLLTPGFFTDALGIALLLPPVRQFLIRRIGTSFMARGRVVVMGAGMPPPGAGRGFGGQGDVVDGDYEVSEPDTGNPDPQARLR